MGGSFFEMLYFLPVIKAENHLGSPKLQVNFIHIVYQTGQCRLTDILLQAAAYLCGKGQFTVTEGSGPTPAADNGAGLAI